MKRRKENFFNQEKSFNSIPETFLVLGKVLAENPKVVHVIKLRPPTASIIRDVHNIYRPPESLNSTRLFPLFLTSHNIEELH